MTNKTTEKYVEVEMEFTDHELLRYMIAAHEADMSFNQFVNQAVKEFLDDEQLKQSEE